MVLLYMHISLNSISGGTTRNQDHIFFKCLLVRILQTIQFTKIVENTKIMNGHIFIILLDFLDMQQSEVCATVNIGEYFSSKHDPFRYYFYYIFHVFRGLSRISSKILKYQQVVLLFNFIMKCKTLILLVKAFFMEFFSVNFLQLQV